MPDLTTRAGGPEMMDDLAHPARTFDEAYRELGLINRYLGGVRAVRRFVDVSRGGTLLDVAGGASDIGADLGKRGGWRCSVLDLNQAALGRVRSCDRVLGDAFRLPFGEGAFDVVAASLFFHHLTDSECAGVLGGMHRIARRRVIVNELHRTRTAFLGILWLTRLASRSAMVRNDAPLSVRRGFRPRELQAIAEQAGLEGTVHRSFPYRLVLVIDK